MILVKQSEIYTQNPQCNTLVVTYRPPGTGIQSPETTCFPSSGSQLWRSSLQSQDGILLLLSLDDWEKQETILVGLQQLVAGLILFSSYVKTRIGALAPGQISPLQLHR